MKTTISKSKKEEGSLLVYFILVIILVSAIASVGAYVAQTTKVAQRRSNMIAAQQYAEGGTLVACSELNSAVTNGTGTVSSNLVSKLSYVKNTSLSTSQTNVFERMISAPFTNQSVKAQIWLPSAASPMGARIVTIATNGNVVQQSSLNVKMTWAYPAAIISSGAGTTGIGIDKPTAQAGNVVVDGNKTGPIIVDGGPGMAIMANGRANIDTTYATVPASSISMTNWGTANQLPDYTSQGTANTLFDFNRFIAVANATTNALNTATHNNHFTNQTLFIAACNAVLLTPAKFLEGVIVVDLTKSDPDFDLTRLPNGINVKGTLFFNFNASFGPLDKIQNLVPLNINPADLSHLVATNTATYTSGYPPVYYDNTKNPVNIDISSKGFANFVAGEDLPALMYSMGTLDVHGPVNVSGVCYTPSYMEIENMNDGQIQYFRGSLIMGLGIYYQNNNKATSIISFDPPSIDSLATLGAAGKQVTIAFWQ